ncbi:MAG TPA: DsbA family oxidoreductase [Paracoccaceae bacterium]|nr:DsbA family oxidoreductase [Paracoccaceae bacterium]
MSDVVCPWCYIGKAKLDRALEAAPGHPFAIAYRPFLLNPDMPAKGMDRAEYLAAKFGRERVRALEVRIEAAAAEAGLELDFGRVRRIPNTLDAQRLIRWSRVTGNQAAVVGRLFRRYFREGDDISDHGVLVSVAESAGMEGELVARLLAGEADRTDILAEGGLARRMGVTGVPTFIIGGRYVLQGAQETETWARLMGEIAAQAAPG